MKKLLSLLLVLSLIAAFFAAVPAFADDKVNISVDTVADVARGTEGAELTVRISAQPRWSSLQAEITFDPEALHFAGITLDPELRRQIDDGEPCIFAVNSDSAAAGVVTFGYASAYSADGVEGYLPGEDGCFCTLSFDIPEDAPFGFAGVGFEVIELSRVEADEPVGVDCVVSGGGMTIVCGHEWQTLQSVPAACEEGGYASFVCSKCGETYEEFYPATGHSWNEWEEARPANCAEEGLEIRICANDPEHIERRSTDPLGHDWGEWETVSAATCVAREVQTRVCARDSSHIEEREFGELDLTDGHSWGEWSEVLAPSCTMSAVEMRVCGNDDSHFETREGASALGHSFGGWVVTTEPGCTEPGVETGRCSRCGAAGTREVSAVGHSWSEWETAVAATCVSEGVETRFCARCGETGSRELAIDPSAHEWSEWGTVSGANCVHGTLEARVCANDASHTESRETGEPDPNAHAWGEWEVTVPVTVYEDGEETRICKNDPSHTETRVIPKPVYTVCDVDFDGVITVSDALRALRIAARLDAPDELIRAAADADFDMDVTVADALIILRKSLGLDK